MKGRIKDRLPTYLFDSNISKVDIDRFLGVQVLKERFSSFSEFGGSALLGPLAVVVGKSGYGKTSLLLSRFLGRYDLAEKNSSARIPVWVEREDVLRYDPVTVMALTVTPYLDVSD